MQTKYEFIYEALANACYQMQSLLDKVSQDSKGEEKRESELLNASLAPDMYSFIKQVQIFTDNVKGSVARLAEVEAPIFEDKEETLGELKARLKKTMDFIKTVTPAQMQEGDQKEIHMNWMPENTYFTGKNYSEKFVLQNTFFHLVTAYGILRMKGMDIGKQDFIVNLEMNNK